MSDTEKITFDHEHSFDANHPPVESGWYAVQLEDGTTDEAEWKDGTWQRVASVSRYSGRPMMLQSTRQEHLVQSILAGIHLPDHLPEKHHAREAALKMARHHASGAARTGVEPDVARQRRRNAVGFYSVAQVLGVIFDRFKMSSTPGPHEANQTDRAIFEAGVATFPDVLAKVRDDASKEQAEGALTNWALEALRNRQQRAKVRATRRASNHGAGKNTEV